MNYDYKNYKISSVDSQIALHSPDGIEIMILGYKNSTIESAIQNAKKVVDLILARA